jgi:hypothetical protein
LSIKNFNLLGLLVLIRKLFLSHFKKLTADTLGWLAAIVLHCATIPSLLAVMNGLTDVMLPVDIVLLVWTALVLLFVKAAIQRDLLNLITIGLGFFVQATLMALIFFK